MPSISNNPSGEPLDAAPISAQASSDGGSALLEEKRIRLYSPHPGQKLFHDCPARFRVLACGRRWGKTLACVNETARFAWQNPGSLSWWVAPSYAQARIAFDEFRSNLFGAIKKSLATMLTIELANGSVVAFKSAEIPDNLRGVGLGFLVVDEAARVRPDAWHEALRPTLTDAASRAVFISTPAGRNWFYDLFLCGQDPGKTQYASWRFATETNPHVSWADIEHARSTLPERVFRQEYEADFLDDERTVFRAVGSLVRGALREPRKGDRCVMGVDLGKYRDFTVCVVLETASMNVIAFDRFGQSGWTIQQARIERMARQYAAELIVDSTGVGDPVYDWLCASGLRAHGYRFTTESKRRLVENLILTVERGEIALPRIPELLAELEGFEQVLASSGAVIYGAPPGRHDDCVIALALAVWHATHLFHPRSRMLPGF